ncbi:MAG: carbon starvation CstA family protein [Verrucomicrobiales bacterium]
MKIWSILVWMFVALVGALGYVTIALHRGETLNSVYILMAALSTYAIGYRFYSKWLATKVLMLNDRRATPCEVHDDGKDFVKTNKWIVFGHHFAAISGPGPLVGPGLAAQFGYMPSAIWIIIGVVLGGAVQDFIILFSSMRRDGKSLGQMVKEELNSTAGAIATVAILAIMIILLAVLALVVVKALAESPWGVFTVAATIPIAMFMGGYMRYWRVGKVLEASAIGIVLLLLAVWGGKFVHETPAFAKLLTIKAEGLAWSVIIYGLAASVLPVWLLLAPRDYLSTFMKLGTILALVLGVFIVLPDLRMPALTKFVDGSGLVFAGKLFPFCFITIACGAISGFHTLIASGTTPKIITRESYARPIGYGAMLLESLVAIMALIAACTLEPGIYLSMNVKGTGPTAEAIASDTVAKVNAAGFKVTVEEMHVLADQVKENTLFGRTGGAATLAVGMAQIFSRAMKGNWMDLWYHFAIMFEALFILTTLDAGTRVGRYLLQDSLGHFYKPLGDTSNTKANVFASTVIVLAWGYFLIQGVRDPLGGINSLWPLFGIANQLLAAIALCLATTIILKMHLGGYDEAGKRSSSRKPAYALITFIPLAFLLWVTMTAGVQKIFSPDPKIGFLSAAKALEAAQPKLTDAINQVRAGGDPAAITAAEKALRNNQIVQFNQYLDAVVAGTFLVLVSALILISVFEWICLFREKRSPTLRETPPTWLPEYAIIEGRPNRFFGFLALGIALLKEVSGQADVERREQRAQLECAAHAADAARGGINASHQHAAENSYVAATEERYKSIRRCC